ncbi:MAG: hypothetical protein GY940_34120 [bacterium]|nr:hypothetical protein [bacterium]
MPLNVASYISSQLDGNVSPSYSADYVGAVQLLENTGFSPFSDASPLNSTLNQVFDRFVRKTGLDTTSNKLTDEFLQENPGTRRALNLYSALENTFSTRSAGQKSAIVDFLNTKIDEFVSTKDSNQNNTLSREEAGIDETLFDEIDDDRDLEINNDELRNNVLADFKEFNNILNYFQNGRGVLIDVFG